MQTFKSTPRGDRIQVVAAELIGCYRERYDANLQLIDIDARLSASRLALMPGTGWPGSNDMARKAAQALAEDSDADFQTALMDRKTLERELMEISSRAEILLIERRAHELCIQEESLAGGYVVNHNQQS